MKVDEPGKKPLCEPAWVEIKGRSAIIKTKSGALAMVPKDDICEIAERFDLCIENYPCPPKIVNKK